MRSVFVFVFVFIVVFVFAYVEVTCLTLGCDPAPEQFAVPAQAEDRGLGGKQVQIPGNRLSRSPPEICLKIHFK